MMLITAGGAHARLDIDPKGPTALEDLQAAVGGWIEVVPCAAGVLIVNENGISLRLRLNPFASHLAGRRIVGDVVFCDRADYERMPRT